MLLLLALAAVPQDTVRLPADEALARAVAAAPRLEAAESRVRAASAAARARGRADNPVLGVLAENLGAEREVTGRDGLAGVEGQVTLELPLTLGGDLGARRRAGEAAVAVARAERDLAGVEFRWDLLGAMALHHRDHAVLAAHDDEVATLAALARAMTARAAEGRSAEGHAARVRLEAASVASRAARRRAAVARADAQLAAALGLGAATPVRIVAPSCAPAAMEGGGIAAARLATARADRAAAEGAVARAARIPDLAPQVGYRRTGGFSGLLLGLAVPLPLRNGGGDAVAAAEAERSAAAGEEAAVLRRLDADAAGARAALALLDARAETFGAAWQADLDRSVTAAEAAWAEGAGTLAELLEARRARLAALEERADWSAARILARLDLARATGVPLEAALLTDPCPGSVR